MIRLGLRLTLRSGRESLIRSLVTAAAVAVGVALLLGVFAEFHAFQVASGRPCWECTHGTAVNGQLGTVPGAELWNYSENIYQGQFIEELDVAALGPNAPVPPGISQLPNAGEYYASPALAALLKTVPANQLGDRFPGKLAGTIGNQALSNPNELAIYVGYSPPDLAALPNTVQVDHIATVPQTQGTTNLYRIAFGMGAIALLFPILTLIATATRLAAARREERFAALRLVGATPGQISVIASVDAAVGALLGAFVGIAIFLAGRPALANVSLSGARFFPDTVTPPVWAYAGILVVVPVAAAIASLVSLWRVQTSPLGVTRRTTPPSPRWWRLVLLPVGVVILVSASFVSTGTPSMLPMFVGVILILAGLLAAGPWLTMQAAHFLAKFGRGASSLLAARRLADNPQAAFRPMSVLVLAVFVGTGIAVLASTLGSAQGGSTNSSLNDVLRVYYDTGATSPNLTTAAAVADSAKIVGELQGISGATVIPIYNDPALEAQTSPAGGGQLVPLPSGPGTGAPPPPLPGGPGNGTRIFGSPPKSVISCNALAELPVLGICPPGAQAVQIEIDQLLTDNPIYIYGALPLVDAQSQAVSIDLSALPLSALFVKTNDAATLERVRTVLTLFDATVVASPDITMWQMGQVEPETFGEVAAVRNNDDKNIERVVLGGVALTMLIAGCSLAVAVGGSLVERKRPFTLLRLTGTPMSTLYKVVLQESALPLIAAAVVAAGLGLGMAFPVIGALIPAGANIHPELPHAIYYATLGAGLVLSLLVIIATLPLLGRITRSDDARFE